MGGRSSPLGTVINKQHPSVEQSTSATRRYWKETATFAVDRVRSVGGYPADYQSC